MINFKLLTEELQNKTGKCLLKTENYLSIPGIRVNCTTGFEASVNVHFVIYESEYRPGEKTIKFLNGVTGYEEFYIADLLGDRHNGYEYIWLNAGSYKYDELKVKYQDLKDALQQCGFV